MAARRKVGKRKTPGGQTSAWACRSCRPCLPALPVKHGLSGRGIDCAGSGPARRASLQQGDIILAINNESVESLETAQAVLANAIPNVRADDDQAGRLGALRGPERLTGAA